MQLDEEGRPINPHIPQVRAPLLRCCAIVCLNTGLVCCRWDFFGRAVLNKDPTFALAAPLPSLQFMAAAPWYLQQEGPGLKHQKNWKGAQAGAGRRARLEAGARQPPLQQGKCCAITPGPAQLNQQTGHSFVPLLISLPPAEEVSDTKKWYDRGAKVFQANKWRKGACEK